MRKHLMYSILAMNIVACAGKIVKARAGKEKRAARGPLPMPGARQCIFCSCASIIFLNV